MGFYHAIVSPPDTVPPSTPVNLTGGSSSSSTAALSWNASTDNVGVAGYSVLRNGQKIAQTAMPQFQDSGVTGASTYTYVVKAFDLAGNGSAPSLSISITTKDSGPPGAPTNVTAAAASCAQVNVGWSASTDINVRSYSILRGTTPTGLTQVAIAPVTITSFSNYGLSASTKYYYGIEAVDTSGYVSKVSTIASATTMALPSAPTHVTATANSSMQIAVNWSAGSSGMPIVAYHIYRGTSANSLTNVGTRTTPSYTDYSMAPNTTYYYAVQETDNGGNDSPMSVTVSATTPST
jgi:fibronectin type 3 domain-containing protein